MKSEIEVGCNQVTILTNATRQIDTTVQQIAASGAGPQQPAGDTFKGILERRVIQGQKPLTGEKSKFRQWHQKFVNAMAQVDEGYCKILKNMEDTLDTGTKIPEATESLADEFEQIEKFSEDTQT